MRLWFCAALGWGLLVEGFQSKILQLPLSTALPIHLPKSFVHPHSVKLIVTRTETLLSNISSLCTSITFCFADRRTDLWLVLMLWFSDAPLNVHYALRFFFCFIIIICSFLSQTKHVLEQQPLKGLAIVICQCGSNSVIAAFHNSHQSSSVNNQGAVRYMMGARSNLATEVYHQDSKHPAGGELSPLPAHGSLTAGQIDGALFFSLTKYSFLWSLGASPDVIAGCKLHERAVLMVFQRDVEPPCKQRGFSRRPKTSALRVILGRLWLGVFRGICPLKGIPITVKSKTLL